MFKITVRKYDENHNTFDSLNFETEYKYVIIDIKDIYNYVNFTSWILPALSQKDYDTFLSEIAAETEIVIVIEQKGIIKPELKEVIEIQAEKENESFAIFRPYVKMAEYRLYRSRSSYNWRCTGVTISTYCQDKDDVGLKVNTCILSNIEIKNGRFVSKYSINSIVKNKVTGTKQVVQDIPNYTGIIWNSYYTLKPIGTYFAEEHDLTEG